MALEGVVATDVSLKALNDFVRGLHVSRHGEVFIMESNGHLIASSNGENVYTEQQGKVDRLRAENSQSLIIRNAYATLQKHLAEIENMGGADTTFTFSGQDGELTYAAYSRVRDGAGHKAAAKVHVVQGQTIRLLLSPGGAGK